MGSNTIEELGSRQFCSECGRPFASEDLVRFGNVAVCAECKPNYVQQMREGAVVAGSIQYGGFWRRLAAVLIDSILLWIVLFPVRLLMASARLTPLDPFRYGFANAFWAAFWNLPPKPPPPPKSPKPLPA